MIFTPSHRDNLMTMKYKILESIMRESCLLQVSIALGLHISKLICFSPFLGGLSHTQRKCISFPFAGKTWCLTCGLLTSLLNLVADIILHLQLYFPLTLEINFRIFLNPVSRGHTSQNICKLLAISSGPLYFPEFCIYKMPDSQLWFRLLWTTSSKQTHTGRKEKIH